MPPTAADYEAAMGRTNLSLVQMLQAVIEKAIELRKKSKAELESHLADLKKELLNLKVQKTASGAANKIAQIRLVRKAISRVLTILSENQKQHVLKLYENKKLNKLPKDLRPKLTRAMRRRLSPREAGKRTLRQIKKDAHFSNVKFAVLA